MSKALARTGCQNVAQLAVTVMCGAEGQDRDAGREDARHAAKRESDQTTALKRLDGRGRYRALLVGRVTSQT